MLTELVEEERSKEGEKKKSENLVKGVKVINDERYDASVITTNTLERLVRDLNEDQVRKAEESKKKVKSMRWDYYNKTNGKDNKLKQKDCNIKTLQKAKVTFKKKKKHLIESIAAKEAEVETTKEKINEKGKVKIENEMLQRKAAE